MPAPSAANPAVALRNGMDRLLGFLNGDNPPSADELSAFLNAEIAPFFDFEYMTESAGGRLYERMQAEEQQSLVEKLKTSFLSKMADKLGGYDNQQVRFLPPRGGNDGRTAQVSVAVLNPGSYPARLDFRLYRNGEEEWKVYDVSANGQSAIVHYRQQLMREMREQRMRQMREQQRMRGPQMPAPMGPGGMPPYGYGPMPPR